MDTSDLAKRMKNYETVSKTKLMRRCPVIVRIDGKSFHTFTRGFKRPFDELLIKTMQETANYLCENIQGCVLGYTQSDEITLVLVDYQRFESCAWFDYKIQKICSISASMATMAFNKFFTKNVKEFDMEWKCGLTPQSVEIQKAHYDYIEVLNKAAEKGAMFDARVFNIPKEEVTNCIYWRQLDASRNSIQMLGQAHFSHKKLQNKSCSDIQDMLVREKGINWNDLPTYLKRGSCVIRNTMVNEPYGSRMLCKDVPDGHWFVDKNIPIFRNEGREYIEDLIK